MADTPTVPPTAPSASATPQAVPTAQSPVPQVPKAIDVLMKSIGDNTGETSEQLDALKASLSDEYKNALNDADPIVVETMRKKIEAARHANGDRNLSADQALIATTTIDPNDYPEDPEQHRKAETAFKNFLAAADRQTAPAAQTPTTGTASTSPSAPAAVTALAPVEGMERKSYEFATNKYDISDAQRKQIAERVAQWKAGSHDMAFVVEGHTDTRGSDEYNFSLAQARADAVRDAIKVELKTQGLSQAEIDQVKFVTHAYHKSEQQIHPTGDNIDDAQNRAAQLSVVTPELAAKFSQTTAPPPSSFPEHNAGGGHHLTNDQIMKGATGVALGIATIATVRSASRTVLGDGKNPDTRTTANPNPNETRAQRKAREAHEATLREQERITAEANARTAQANATVAEAQANSAEAGARASTRAAATPNPTAQPATRRPGLTLEQMRGMSRGQIQQALRNPASIQPTAAVVPPPPAATPPVAAQPATVPVQQRTFENMTQGEREDHATSLREYGRTTNDWAPFNDFRRQALNARNAANGVATTPPPASAPVAATAATTPPAPPSAPPSPPPAAAPAAAPPKPINPNDLAAGERAAAAAQSDLDRIVAEHAANNAAVASTPKPDLAPATGAPAAAPASPPPATTAQSHTAVLTEAAPPEAAPGARPGMPEAEIRSNVNSAIDNIAAQHPRAPSVPEAAGAPHGMSLGRGTGLAMGGIALYNLATDPGAFNPLQAQNGGQRLMALGNDAMLAQVGTQEGARVLGMTALEAGASKLAIPVAVAVSTIDIGVNIYNSNAEGLTTAVGGAGGTLAGAGIGVAAGAWVFGVGAVPGAAIGAAVGGVSGAVGSAYASTALANKGLNATWQNNSQETTDRVNGELERTFGSGITKVLADRQNAFAQMSDKDIAQQMAALAKVPGNASLANYSVMEAELLRRHQNEVIKQDKASGSSHESVTLSNHAAMTQALLTNLLGSDGAKIAAPVSTNELQDQSDRLALAQAKTLAAGLSGTQPTQALKALAEAQTQYRQQSFDAVMQQGAIGEFGATTISADAQHTQDAANQAMIKAYRAVMADPASIKDHPVPATLQIADNNLARATANDQAINGMAAQKPAADNRSAANLSTAPTQQVASNDPALPNRASGRTAGASLRSGDVVKQDGYPPKVNLASAAPAPSPSPSAKPDASTPPPARPPRLGATV